MTESEHLFHRVLLLEDNPSHVVLIRRAMKELVGEIVVAENLAEARDALSTAQFDLIVSDVNLPDSSSVAVVKQLRKEKDDQPVIVLTSSASLAEAVEAMKLGARDFIVKNFDEGFREVLGLSLSRVAAAIESEREKLRLQRETAVLREVIENSPDGLAVVDQSGVTLYSNSSFRRFMSLMSVPLDCPVMFPDEHVVGAADCNAFLNEALKSSQSGAVMTRELEVRSAAADTFELSISAVPGMESEELHDHIILLRDLTTLKKRERFQREILSTTTHDLRGPLGAVLTASELLLDMLPSGEKTHELVLRSRSAAQGMLNLIDEFLSARRIEEGSFILKPRSFPVADLVDEVETNYGTIATARGIELDLETLRSSEVISADRLGVSRALGNVVGNALKFTPRGGSVEVFFRTESEHVVLGVRDSGDGMSAAELRQLFEKFSRLDKHRGVAGSGLGLFVVRSIIEAHGGSVRVQSQPGNGSVFELVIPRSLPLNERGELLMLDTEEG